MIAYVAGPYREGHGRTIDANIKAATLVAIDLWKLGCAVICPHLNTAHFDGFVPDEQFLAGDLEILSKCDAVVLAPHWHESQGAIGELKRARELGLPVYEWYAIGHIREIAP